MSGALTLCWRCGEPARLGHPGEPGACQGCLNEMSVRLASRQGRCCGCSGWPTAGARSVYGYALPLCGRCAEMYDNPPIPLPPQRREPRML